MCVRIWQFVQHAERKEWGRERHSESTAIHIFELDFVCGRSTRFTLYLYM